MLSKAYNDGVEAALEKYGVAMESVGDTAGSMVAKGISTPEFTRSVDSFTGLAAKNLNSSLSMKRAMPKAMTNVMASTATKVMK